MAGNVKQIAQIAGVSRGTVDRALNGRPGVKKEVADKIMEIALALNYKPNKVAQAFARSNKGRKIGVVINSEGNPFFDEVLRGINCSSEQIDDFGVKVLVKTARGYDVTQQIALIDELVQENINLLALTPIDDPEVGNRLNQLIVSGIEVVTFNTDIHSVDRLAYVGCDYLQSGGTAAGLLGMMTGEQAVVGIVTGSLKIMGHLQRIQGFRSTVADEFPSMKIAAVVENNDNDETSYQLVKKMLQKNPEITALYFSAAGIEGGMRAVSELRSIKRPRIITVDLIPAVEGFLREGLVSATICQDPFRQGYEAIKLLFDYLVTGEKPESSIIHTETKILLKYNLD